MLTRAVLAGGVRIVQYRAKTGVVYAHARAMREFCRAAGALFIVNDDAHAALELHADGLHAGPEDRAWKEARLVRRQLGEGLLGFSCGSRSEAEFAQQSGADYLGVGPCFTTASKADAGAPIGPDGLRSIVTSTALPVAAVGGITAANVAQVAACGAAMAAVISALCVDDPQAAARELISLWGAP
jgi:thiamine-phosphate diphosphorylase